MLPKIHFFATFCLVNLLGVVKSQSFISQPSNPTYAFKGGNVFFNWSYTSNSAPWSKRWYQASSTGSPIGALVMTQLGTNNPTVIKSSFIGRVNYVSNAAMLITNVSLADAGFMKFDVTFVNNAALDNKVELIVTIPPTIAAGLKNESIVYEGKESRLECAFDARPTPIIKWYLNDIEMRNIRYSINTTTIGYIGDTIRVQSVLLINSSMPEDSGVISCFAVLPNANLSSKTNHIVLYEPRDTQFKSDKANHVGSLGQSTTFTCSAHGNPTIFYQIYKDGVLIRNSTSGAFTLNSIAISDEGRYTCKPINKIGAGPLKEFNFTVHIAPSLLKSTGSSLKTVVGSQLSLSCTFYGEPTPNITWRKHQNSISDTANINATILSTNSSFSVVQSLLTLDKVSKFDYGLYECRANNIAGFLAHNISVDVHYEPTFNKSLKQNYTLTEDVKNNRSWVCKAEGNPQMIINWLINGKPVMNGFTVVEKKNQLSSNGYEIESTLTMVGINRINAGTLTCNASNVIGSQQSHSKIIIQYAPSARIILRDKTNTTLNSSVNFICDVSSLPSPQIHWEKDGIILNLSDNIISERVSYSSDFMVNMQKNLTIMNTKKSDFGTYRCIAVNSIGNLTQQTILNVLYKVEFMTSLVPVSYVQQGTRNFKLQCIAVGNPEPMISWLNNGTVMQNNSEIEIMNSINKTVASQTINSMLTFKKISKIYYGNYTCVASNYLGSISSTNLLIITYQPLIVKSSANLVVNNASQTITLFCEIHSNPPAFVDWKIQNQKRDGLVYVNRTYALPTSPDKTSFRTELMIINSTMYDNGIYSCVANNSIGMVEHNTTLVIQYAPINVTSLLVEYHEVENAPFLISCSFLSNPGSSVFWKYNGTLIKDISPEVNETSFVSEKRIDRVITNSSVRIKSLTRRMRGDYECFAKNHQGVFALKTTLIVNYEPTFLSQALSKIELDAKENTTLSCKVESSPVSTITWVKDGQSLQNDSKIQISHKLQFEDRFKGIMISTMRLIAVNKSDTGNYSCKAENKLATKYQRTRMVVRYSPEITTNFGSQQNLTESSVPLNFACSVESHPPSTVQWFKDGFPYNHNVTTITVSSSDAKTTKQSNLRFPNGIKRENFGFYICKAGNTLGNASKTTDVKVWYGPEFHSNLSGQVNITKAGNASFECIVEANPSPAVDWYKNGIKIASNRYAILTQTTQISSNKVITRSVFKINTVDKPDTATYKCQAANIVTTTHQSIHLNVQYRPKLLVASTNLTVNKTNKVSLNCFVDANPAMVDYIWTKDGHSINHNEQTYRIASAKNLSTGIYKCTPRNIIGSGETITFGLLVRIPPTFIKKAECKPNRVTNMMACGCSGWGVPQPTIYWTKDSNITTLASGGYFQKSLSSKSIDGRYHCHLRNILGEIITTSSFYYYIPPTSDWQAWGKCNTTCGSGYQTRERICNIQKCFEHLSETRNCTAACAPPTSEWQTWSKCNATCGSGYQTRERICNIQICVQHLSETKNCTVTCVPPAKQKDKPWAVALYVLIPVCFVLLVLLIFWLARTNRRKHGDDAVVIPVNGHLAKPPSVRSVPTRRDIYLPEKSFGSINPAYFVDDNDLQNSFNQSIDKKEMETEELGMKLEQNSVKESSTDKTDEQSHIEEGLKQSPSLDGTSDNRRKSSANEVYEDPDEVDTYLGPDGQTVSYSFYNEISTAL